MTNANRSSKVDEQMGKLNFGDSDDKTDRLIIGLDFGTTYSGYVLLLLSSSLQHKMTVSFAELRMSLQRSLTKFTPLPNGLARKEEVFRKPLQLSSTPIQSRFNGAMSSSAPSKRRLRASNCYSIPIRKSLSMFPQATRMRS